MNQSGGGVTYGGTEGASIVPAIETYCQFDTLRPKLIDYVTHASVNG